MAERKGPNPRSLAGITLFECLAAVAIMLVLSGIGYAVVLSSKQKAKEASEISNLHQLAIAGALYREDNGEWPLSVEPLVRMKLVPAAITTSILDASPQGLANDLALSISSQCPACGVSPTTFRRTFIGPADFGMIGTLFQREIEPTPGAGWLVSLTRSTPGRPTEPKDKFNNPAGDYFRVLLSGGVVSRTHRRVVHAGGTIYAMPYMFADGNAAWQQRIAAGSP